MVTSRKKPGKEGAGVYIRANDEESAVGEARTMKRERKRGQSGCKLCAQDEEAKREERNARALEVDRRDVCSADADVPVYAYTLRFLFPSLSFSLLLW